MGALPPTSNAEWQRLFELYQKIPQYSLVNEGFGLDGFKHIFWLEWTHRLWGRLIGLAFIVPLVWFAVTARIERSLIPRLALLFVLGGLQGAIGWFMVASGFFPDSTAVSAYRLVMHLVLALVLYGAIVWTALSLLRPTRFGSPHGLGLRCLAASCFVLVALTIVAGGFVAGTHAGLTYNTFPLMDGRLVPEGYATLHPILRNLTENIAAVQFDHRLLATVTAGLVAGLAIAGLASRGLPLLLAACLLIAVAAQYSLGVATLLGVVPVPLATAHQAGAVLLLTVVLVTLHHLTRTRRAAAATPGEQDRPEHPDPEARARTPVS